MKPNFVLIADQRAMVFYHDYGELTTLVVNI